MKAILKKDMMGKIIAKYVNIKQCAESEGININTLGSRLNRFKRDFNCVYDKMNKTYTLYERGKGIIFIGNKSEMTEYREENELYFSINSKYSSKIFWDCTFEWEN